MRPWLCSSGCAEPGPCSEQSCGGVVAREARSGMARQLVVARTAKSGSKSSSGRSSSKAWGASDCKVHRGRGVRC